MAQNNVTLALLLALILAATGALVVGVVSSSQGTAPTVEGVTEMPTQPAEPVAEASTTVSASTSVTLGGRAYVVQDGDTLEAVADAVYGDGSLFPAIVWASTLKAAEDPDYAINTENGQIEAGKKLWIPDDVEALQRQFEQAAQVQKDLEETTLEQLQAMMQDGTLSAERLVQAYLERIRALNNAGPRLNAVLEVNPDALAQARALDQERQAQGPRGPLHGIPILLKDNIDTADRMQTTAGSLALLDSRPARDASVAQRLREAGAVILGKANLSEWANFRGNGSISGWSARGGLTRNPYRLDATPWGSSSGSAVAVAANLAAAALGTETAGSIVAPAAINGIVGLKPTVGLTSRAGVVPIAHSFDTVGPMARSVADAAVLLGAIAGVDGRDPSTAAAQGHVQRNYSAFLDSNGLAGARIGVPENLLFLQDEDKQALWEAALDTLRAQGATVVSLEMTQHKTFVEWINGDNGLLEILEYEFKADLNQYLTTRVPTHPGADAVDTLAELIAFNRDHAQRELLLFGQELFEQSQTRGGLSEIQYLEGLYTGRSLAGREGIDALLSENNLDALVLPTLESWARAYTAMAGYPLLTVPAGFTSDGLPFGIGFFASAFSEPTLIRLAYAFEQTAPARQTPRFLLTLPQSQPAVSATTETTSSAASASIGVAGAESIGDSLYPLMGNGGYDVTHYTIDLAVDVAANAIQGSTTIEAIATQNLATFNLDFEGLTVSGVQVDGHRAEFTRAGDELTVLPGEPLSQGQTFSTTVFYAGTPQPIRDPALSFAEIGWNPQPNGTFVVSQPSGAKSWYPVNNHPLDKATYTFRITVPTPYMVAANGLLKEKIEQDQTTTYVWEAADPVASYLTTVHIGEYEVQTQTTESGVPLRNYFPKGTSDAVKAKFAATPQMVAYLEDLLGPYPFESYGVALLNVDVGFALETQTLSTFGKQGAGEVVVMHELAHQWFGNSVSLADWQDIWLNEGFATYLSFLWLEHRNGPEAFSQQMDAIYRQLVNRRMGPPGSVSVDNLFNNTVYLRGAWTLHALRLALGDGTFFDVLRAYYARFQNANATTEDFKAVVNEVGGQDFSALLDAWLYDEAVPPHP